MPVYQLSEAFLPWDDYKIEIDPCPKYFLLFPPPPEERNVVGGDGENDYLAGTDGHDIQYGRMGDDVLYGSPGYDEMRGGYGNDTADYYSSHCPVYVDLEKGQGWGGDAHGDTYFGIENIFGSHGDDTLIGDRNDNVINGSRGSDLIEGGRGNDSLQGGGGYNDGDDTLRGGDGEDSLYGGRGENFLTGGADGDMFEFFFVDTVTTVTDFTPGEDVMRLVGLYDFAYFMDNATEVGGDVHFSRDNGYLNYTATLIIENVALADLDAGDFVFA